MEHREHEYHPGRCDCGYESMSPDDLEQHIEEVSVMYGPGDPETWGPVVDSRDPRWEDQEWEERLTCGAEGTHVALPVTIYSDLMDAVKNHDRRLYEYVYKLEYDGVFDAELECQYDDDVTWTNGHAVCPWCGADHLHEGD